MKHSKAYLKAKKAEYNATWYAKHRKNAGIKQETKRRRKKVKHSKAFLKARTAMYNKRWYQKKHRKSNKAPREEIRYSGKDKQAIREHKLMRYNQLYQKNRRTSGIDFHGAEGTSFNFIKDKTKAKILSIDCDPAIGKTLVNIPNARYTTLQNICNEKRERFNIFDLDYCGDLNEEQEDDIASLPNIMMDEGIFWLTLSMRTGKFEKNTRRGRIEREIENTIKHILLEKGISCRRNFTVKYAGKTIDIITNRKKKETPMKFYEFSYKRIKHSKKRILEWFAIPEFITIKDMKKNYNYKQ